MLAQVTDIGLAAQEPQQLVDDRPQVHLLRRQQREPRGQIEAHLVAEDAECAHAGAILLADAVVENMLHQVKVLSHVASRYTSARV